MSPFLLSDGKSIFCGYIIRNQDIVVCVFLAFRVDGEGINQIPGFCACSGVADVCVRLFNACRAGFDVAVSCCVKAAPGVDFCVSVDGCG